VTHRVVIAPTALKMLAGISDRRIRDLLVKRIDGLQTDPEKQGKALVGELSGYRSLRVSGQRYRIIYRVCRLETIVYVVAVGIRKEGSREDIYRLAQKLIRLRLVEPER